MPGESETEISKRIRDGLTARGCRVIRIQSGILRVLRGKIPYFVHCAEAGTPDLAVLLPGEPARHIWLEVKRPGQKPTPEQIRWHLWAKKSGVEAFVVHSLAEALATVFGENV